MPDDQRDSLQQADDVTLSGGRLPQETTETVDEVNPQRGVGTPTQRSQSRLQRRTRPTTGGGGTETGSGTDTDDEDDESDAESARDRERPPRTGSPRTDPRMTTGTPRERAVGDGQEQRGFASPDGDWEPATQAAPGRVRSGGTEPVDTGVEAVPGPSRRTAADRPDPASKDGQSSSGGTGDELPTGVERRDIPEIDTEVLADGEQVGIPDRSFGSESRTDLSVPGRQEELERQAKTDIVDVADAAFTTATNNPYKAAAFTAATPVPGDEVIGGGIAIGSTGARIAGGLFSVGATALANNQNKPEFPTPRNPGQQRNELPVSEGGGFGQSEFDVEGDLRNRPEISVTNDELFTGSELPVGESARDQPEIPLSGDGTATTGQASRDSVVPDEFPLAGRDLPADPRREYVDRFQAGQQLGRQRGRDRDLTRDRNRFREDRGASREELEEILDVDPTTIGEQERQRFRRRRFPTGEGAVVGRSTPTETETSPENPISRERDQLRDVSDGFGAGAGSGTAPPPIPPAIEERRESATESLLDPVGGDLRARPKSEVEPTPALESPADTADPLSETPPVQAIDPVTDTETGIQEVTDALTVTDTAQDIRAVEQPTTAQALSPAEATETAQTTATATEPVTDTVQQLQAVTAQEYPPETVTEEVFPNQPAYEYGFGNPTRNRQRRRPRFPDDDEEERDDDEPWWKFTDELFSSGIADVEFGTGGAPELVDRDQGGELDLSKGFGLGGDDNS